MTTFNHKRLYILIVILIFSIGAFIFIQKRDFFSYLITGPELKKTITNQAYVTYEDTQGKKYGPVYSAPVTVTVLPPAPFRFKYKIKGRKTYRALVRILFKDRRRVKIEEIESEGDKRGEIPSILPSRVKEGEFYYVVIKIPHCLSKRVSVKWPPSNREINFGEIIPGNLDDRDNEINEKDWEVLKSKWGTSDTVADLNEDKLVNSIDWSLMNQFWGQKGEE